MTKFTEDDLEFDFSWADYSENYDCDVKHAGHEMKRVDFIAEKGNQCYFFEIKDPDHPKAGRNLEGNKVKFLAGNLVHDLAAKYRDSLWFKALCYEAQKELHYVVLFSMKSMDPALLMARSDALKKAIPLTHREWVMDMASSCIILNLEQFKKRFGHESVRRISESGA
jgi:hypothetical protein